MTGSLRTLARTRSPTRAHGGCGAALAATTHARPRESLACAVPPDTLAGVSRSDSSPDESSLIWYFAYGSNMQVATFEGRRGMRPLRRSWGTLKGYRLCFDLPVGPGERGVANVIADDCDYVCGVLYLLTLVDMDRLDLTEGVPNGYYGRIEVEVVESSGSPVRVCTYASSSGSPGRRPSPRYIGLLLEGAREHGLPADYLARLQAFELAHDERVQDA